MFQTKVLEKIETQILCDVNALWKSYRLGDNTEKYGTDRLTTYDNMMRRMRFAELPPTHIHSEYVIRIAFPRQQWLCKRGLFLRLYVHCLS
jgi:hypothetical protein